MFPSVFVTSPTTYQTNALVMQETILPKIGDFSEQINRRLDEVILQIQQMQATFNVSQTRNVPKPRRVIVCYTCGVEDIYLHDVLRDVKVIGIEACINFIVIKTTLTTTLTNSTTML